MPRLLIWFMLIYIVWKIARLFRSYAGRYGRTDNDAPTFDNIEEAQYEDLSKNPTDSATHSQDH